MGVRAELIVLAAAATLVCVGVAGMPRKRAAAVTSPLLDRDAILNGCSRTAPPFATFATAQQMTGDWCGLAGPGSNATSQPCARFSISTEGDKLRLIAMAVSNGAVTKHANKTFSQIDNESWLSHDAGKTDNFYGGFSSDGKIFRICGTTEPHGQQPSRVVEIVFNRCLPPTDDASDTDARRCHATH